MFVADVARGRGVTVETVRSEFGQGRMVMARDAVKVGMVDRVATFDETLARMERSATGAKAIATATASTVQASAWNAVAAANQTLVNGITFKVAPPPEPEATKDSPEAALRGFSFADEADELHERQVHLVERARSLAEYRDAGRLTTIKRERLSACLESCREFETALQGLLSDTDPDKQRQDTLAAFTAFQFAAQTRGAA
jgi:hypothetical protein